MNFENKIKELQIELPEAKPGRMSASIIKDLGEHPEDKKPVRVMKGQYGPYIKYKSLNATIPEEKDPTELTNPVNLIQDLTLERSPSQAFFT